MSTKRGLLKGKKMSNAHTTILETAEPMVAAARKRDEVTRVRPGLIKRRSGGRKSMKIEALDGALNLKICGDGGVQHVIVHSQDISATIVALQASWDALYG